MLRETIRTPVFKDPTVQVRVNVDMFVGGELVTAGSVALMQRSDADALGTVSHINKDGSTVRRVERII